MSASVMVPLSGRPQKGPVRPVDAESLVVGKDIVELLSTAMYVDPLSVYREYVQNAVDSIDAAVRAGVLQEGEGCVEITLDPVERSARVRDNGLGVPAGEAERLLTAFGASRKRGMPAGEARGFRGVGRLAALGYAQTVTFRTKAAGETRGTEVSWDCRRLRDILHDAEYAGTLNDVIADVVTAREGAPEAADAHYFEVHLEKIVRLRNDELLNDAQVAWYLAQVAPVPFPQEFAFAAAIEEHLAQYLRPSTYNIRINGGPTLTRPFRDEFALTQTKTDHFQSLQTITVEDPDAGVVAVGWILHHNYLGAIQAASELRGLRARMGNIQIGGSDIFIDAFPESRFNAWTVGEFHILDPRVVPNGRRDNFERNAAATALAHRLLTYGRDIARHCRISSTRRVQLKRFEGAEVKAGELLDILMQGALPAGAAETMSREVGSLLGEMEKLVGGLALDTAAAELQDRLVQLRTRFDALVQLPAEAAEASGPVARIPEQERDAFRWAVELIYECAANRGAAKLLVDRMMARLAGSVE
jgi:molecular chaperone HtpG